MFSTMQFIVGWFLRRLNVFVFKGSWSWKCRSKANYLIAEDAFDTPYFRSGALCPVQTDWVSGVWRSGPLSEWKTHPEKGVLFKSQCFERGLKHLFCCLYCDTSAQWFLLSFLSAHGWCLILQKGFPQMEARARTNPSCQLILLDIICLCCMELICKCKFSSYCFLNYTWLLVIAEVCSSDILIKSWRVDVFIYLHAKKRVLLSAFKGPFLIQNTIV